MGLMSNERFKQKLENHEYAKGSAFAWRNRALSMAHQRNEVLDAAKDLVALWESPTIRGLPRAERNAAIEDTRNRLIAAVHAVRAAH